MPSSNSRPCFDGPEAAVGAVRSNFRGPAATPSGPSLLSGVVARRRSGPMLTRQLVEYALAAFLMGFAMHAHRSGALALVAGGGALVLVAALSDGPLGVARVV